jgi:hypothetical protein
LSAALINEIAVALNGMKETSIVDQSIVNNLNGLANMFIESQEKWLTSRNTRVNIYFYYAARIAGLVVSRMKARFLSDGARGDPKIAEESLQVLGLIGAIHDLTKQDKPDESAAKLVMERVRELRAVATNTKLMQAQEKELEDVDKLVAYLSKLRR